MTTWIALPDLMNLDRLRRLHSSASCLTVRVRIRSIHIRNSSVDCLECESMADYHDIYLKCDVLLLADFFDKFRATCLSHYSLDAVHYYTALRLSWDAALRMTHVSQELITDRVVYHFVEKSIRGGISMITTSYAQANFPILPGYDASRPHAHLYGWAMSQPLPTGGFRFLQPDDIGALALVGGAIR